MKKRKKINLYTVGIATSIALIVISILTVLKPQEKLLGTQTKKNNGLEIVQTATKADEEINEKDAKKAIKKQFQLLGENDIKEENLNLKKIERKGETYYYITSSRNTAEVKIKGGEITRINSVLVN